MAGPPAGAVRTGGAGSVGTGPVGPSDLVVADPAEPYGLRADVDGYLAATSRSLERADLVVVDLGDMNRAAWHARVAAANVAEGDRRRALGRGDEYLAGLGPPLAPDTLLLGGGGPPPPPAAPLPPGGYERAEVRAPP